MERVFPFVYLNKRKFLDEISLKMKKRRFILNCKVNFSVLVRV